MSTALNIWSLKWEQKQYLMNTQYIWGFLNVLAHKESTCNAIDMNLIPGSGRSHGGEQGNPFQYSCLESPMDWGTWRATPKGLRRVGQDWSDWACMHERVSDKNTAIDNMVWEGFFDKVHLHRDMRSWGSELHQYPEKGHSSWRQKILWSIKCGYCGQGNTRKQISLNLHDWGREWQEMGWKSTQEPYRTLYYPHSQVKALESPEHHNHK